MLSSVFSLSDAHSIENLMISYAPVTNYLLHGLWSPEFQCRIHKGSPIILIVGHINPISRIDSYLFKIHSNILYVQAFLKVSFLVGLPGKILIALLLSSKLATWPAHLSLLDLIALTILTERYKPWSSSLWSLLRSFESLLGPNNLLRSCFQILLACV